MAKNIRVVLQLCLIALPCFGCFRGHHPDVNLDSLKESLESDLDLESLKAEGTFSPGQVEQCDASSPGKVFTIGVRYRRSSAVETTLKNAHGLSGIVGHAIGRGVRSNLMAKNVGADWQAVNSQISEQAPDQIGTGLSAKFIMTYHNPATDVIYKRLVAPDGSETKSGLVLLQFKLCGMSNAVRFFRCDITKDSAVGYGTLADFIAVRGWNAVAKIPGFGRLLRSIVMSQLMEQLPGQILYGLEQQVGGGTKLGTDGEVYANTHVCFLNNGFKERLGHDSWTEETLGPNQTDRLFRQLNDPDICPPVEPKPPEAPPKNGACDAPKFNEIQEGDTYCAAGENQLSAGQMMWSQIWGCEDQCLHDPRCNYFSYWRSGKLSYCRTHKTCRKDGMVTEEGARIAIFRRTSLAKFLEISSRSGEYCLGALSQGPSWGLASCRSQCLENVDCKYFSFSFSGIFNYCRLHAHCGTRGREDAQVSIFEYVDPMTPLTVRTAAAAADVEYEAVALKQTVPNTVISGNRLEQAPTSGTALTDPLFGKVDVTDFFNDQENGGAGRITRDGAIHKCCCKKAASGVFDCVLVDLVQKMTQCRNTTTCSCHAGPGFNSYRDRRTSNHRCIISRDAVFLVDDNL